MNLTEKALAVRQKRKPGRPPQTPQELIDLSLAWARGDVTTGQCLVATGYSDSNFYGHIASCFRAVVQQGMLVEPKSARGWR